MVPADSVATSQKLIEYLARVEVTHNTGRLNKQMEKLRLTQQESAAVSTFGFSSELEMILVLFWPYRLLPN